MAKTLPLFRIDQLTTAKPKQISTVAPEKRLNDLTGREWMKFSKSWFLLKKGRTDREKMTVHPATFPAELAKDYIRFWLFRVKCGNEINLGLAW